MKKPTAFRDFKEFLIITFGAAIIAATVFFFMIPSQVAIGSMSAFAMVLGNFISLPISVISLAINVVLLIIGFILVGSEFGIKTVYTSVLIPILLGVFELIFPNFQSLTQDPLLDVLCHIPLVSVGMAILFSCNASSGGLDIVAKILNKYFRVDLGKASAMSGIAIALSSALVPGNTGKIVVLSVLGTYFNGIVVDHFIFGLNIKRRVCIISPKLDEIVEYILHDLHSGATLYNGIGAYSKETRREVVVIVDKNEYRKLMEFVRKTDPKAFVAVYSVNEIRYQPKVWQ